MPYKLTIEDMHVLARGKNGKCLSKKYLGNKVKLEWQCSERHKFWMVPNNVQQGLWCSICAPKVRAKTKMDKSFERVKKIAIDKGGICFSKSYDIAYSKLKFRCKNGHEWEAGISIIKSGHWCPICSAKINAEKRWKYTLEDLIDYAKTHGGECLSTKYEGPKPIKWRCSKGHEWKSVFSQMISQKSWCHKCAQAETGKKRRMPIERLQKVAKERGGELLSKEYKESHLKLQWRCKENHIFWQPASSVLYMNTWCPICTTGISERICKEYFKIIFNKDFPKKRPKWLLNENGRTMELDGYCEELQLAFEYQGHQHFLSQFHGENVKLEELQLHDELKQKICKEKGITLISVPYTIKYGDMQKFIINECKKTNVIIPKEINFVDYRSLDVNSPKYLKEMQQIAKSMGGECLSSIYVNSSTKLIFQCKNEHIFGMVPAEVKREHWCPECAGVKQLSLSYVQEFVKSKYGGKCLSTEYRNTKTKMKFKCKEGHIFWMKPNTIFSQDSWCKECGYKIGADKIRKTIEEMHEVAKSRQGKCLSDKYITTDTKLKWQCEKGHEWMATPHTVKRGSWCPICARTRKKYKKFPHKHKF